MRKDVCSFGGSYSREELWYNDTMNQFFVDQYHYGVIDDEEHFDGTEQIDTLSALRKMIENNKLRAVLMYQNELNLSRDLFQSLVSGSPICQNGKIVGAVTHVLLNDPTREYGIFIETMLNAAK